MEIKEIENPQFAKAVAGVVTEPTGAWLRGVKVDDLSADWKVLLRSTETDDKGRFRFSPVRGKAVYCLQLSRAGFNWVRVKLEIDKKAKPVITVGMPIGTLLM